MGAWSDIAAKIKATHALRYFHHRNEDLTREVLDLMISLEKIVRTRYGSGLAAQQDVIRAQIEQTNVRSELVALAGEGRQMDARLNALLSAARETEQLAMTSLLPQAELTVSSAMASYENGKVDFATLLDAQRQIRQARQSQLKAQFEAQVRLAEIEKLLGEDL